MALVDHGEEVEDEVPDWSAFAHFAKSLKHNPAEPPIPKRGDKDFAPSASSVQQDRLHASRNALFNALSTDSRAISSRTYNSAIWDPVLSRAYLCQSSQNTAAEARGIQFQTMGYWDTALKQLHLLPEEVLYLVERGSLESFALASDGLAPMSVQQTWAATITSDGLTPEKYQIYAYLRRLGYTVRRTSHWPALAPKQSLLAFCSAFLHRCFAWITNLRIARPSSSIVSIFHSRSYASIFQLIRSSRPPPVLKCGASQYSISFDVWKPVTKFAKRNPPLPDFQIAVINAQRLPIPQQRDLHSLFAETADRPTHTQEAQPNKRVNIFARLKHVKPSLILAVVDSGTSTFLRVGRANFWQYPLL